MATVRLGNGSGGLWKHYEQQRQALQEQVHALAVRLAASTDEATRAQAESAHWRQQHDEVAARCEQLARGLARREDELQGSRANVTALMALLQDANERRAMVAEDRDAWEGRCHEATDALERHRLLAARLEGELDEGDAEAARLRDQLYVAQEQHEGECAISARLTEELDVLRRSHATKNRQLVALQRERDELARKLADQRVKSPTTRMRSATATEHVVPQQQQLQQPQKKRDESRATRAAMEATANQTDAHQDVNTTSTSSSSNVTPSTVNDRLWAAARGQFEREKDALRRAAQWARGRVEAERALAAELGRRLAALEVKHRDLERRHHELAKRQQKQRQQQQDPPSRRTGAGGGSTDHRPTSAASAGSLPTAAAA